ncbi:MULTISPECIES: hypothetical protein [unclassified Erwinia]|uniref:hypothetical protein n=1 Tax=unclassified Erwinia TaxID=2622719 RepID=UPI0013040FA3|nr:MULTISPECIES: hypothetical protein [unclassified Erwinia]
MALAASSARLAMAISAPALLRATLEYIKIHCWPWRDVPGRVEESQYAKHIHAGCNGFF